MSIIAVPFGSLTPPPQVDAQPLAIINSNMDLIERWLHGKSPRTQRAYKTDVGYFLAFIEDRSFTSVSLNDVQDFADALVAQGYEPATVARRVNAVKSLLKFGREVGALAINAGQMVKSPKVKDTLAERILTESQVMQMIVLESKLRNQLLLRLLYATGGRVSEICGLKWRDLVEVENGGAQATLFGKGEKTRCVRFSQETWQQLQQLQSGPNIPVFRSQKGGHLTPQQVGRIVRAAAKRANIPGKVSPHWFRHSHASHALERGAGIHLVQATLGHSSVAVTSRYLHARPQDSSGLYLVV